MRVAAIALGAGLSACTTIELAERDAFDVKRLVTEDMLARGGVTRRDLRMRMADGTHLAGWSLERPDAEATVLVFGGNGFLMATSHALTAALLELPVEVIMFDYRGYGQSEGAPSVAAFESDALEVYDFVVQQLGRSPARIVLHGHSLGSFVALSVAQRRETAAVVLENPVTNVAELVEGWVPWFLDPLVRFDVDPALTRPDNVPPMTAPGPPVLIFGGEADPIAPAWMARRLAEVAPEGRARLVEIAGGGHNDLPSSPGFIPAYAALVDQI
jgi:pimeloyl-ACP methyl ester carboxylesterase